MDIVEFALKFKDLASTQLKEFGAAAKQTFTQANAFTSNLSGKNKILSMSYDELEKQIKQVEHVIRTSTIPSQIAKARAELTQLRSQAAMHQGNLLGRSSSSSGGVGIGSIIGGGLVVGGLMKAAGMLTGFVSDSVDKGLERSQIRTSFNVLAGKEQGGKLTKDLVDLQKNTILGSEVFKNAQTMMGFGFGAGDVISNMKMLGDVSMGDKDRLGALTLAFSQVRAAGKLTGQDLLQFVNAGFNPLQQISEKTGKSIGILKKEMESGLISFEMVQQAFKDATGEGGRYNNMLEEIAKTPAGKKAQFEGAVDEFKTSLGTVLQPLMSIGLEFGNMILPMLEAGLTPLANMISGIVGFVEEIKSGTGGWSDYINTIKGYFSETIVPMAQALWGFISNIVGDMVAFVKQSELLKDLFKLIAWVGGLIGDLITGIINNFRELWNNVIKPIIEGIENVYRWFKGMDGMKASVELKKPADEKKQQDSAQIVLQDIAKNTATNAESAKQAESTISGGGQKVLNITVQKFFDNINLNTTTLTEGVADIEEKILEMFSRVLANGAVK